MTPFDDCPTCAESVPPEARFCPSCGVRLTAPRGAHSRFMSVVFCDLTRSTTLNAEVGDEAMFALLNRYQGVCNTVTAEHGGVVAKYMGDGMLAYFGYPEAMKNSAVPAVTAALQIVGQMAGVRAPGGGGSLSARAGVATGWMVVGDANTGAPSAEILAIGETVTLASRLQSEAKPGEVVVAAGTGTRLDGAPVALVPLGPRQIRGFDAPVEAWRVEPSSTRTERRTFVGREAARERLRRAWEDAQRGRCVAVEITAPAGMGKTALVTAFLSAEVPEGRHFTIRGEPYRRDRSFAALRPTVLDWATIKSGTGPEAGRRALEEWAPAETVPGLSLLCRFNAEPVPPLRRVELIGEAVLELFATRLPEAPTVIVIEDAHWLDHDSADLVARLGERLADRALMLLITRRPEGRNTALAPAEPVDLGGLSEGEAMALLEMLDPDLRMSPETRRGVIARAGGVPLYLEHIGRAVVERPDRAARSDVPPSMIEALLARVDLVSHTRELLEGAAILGNEVRVDVLAHLLGRPADAVSEQVGDLISRGLFAPGRDGIVGFDHMMTRDAVLQTILRARVRQLHERALDAYRAVDPARLGEAPIIEATHLMGAERPVEGIPLLIAAAQTALMRGEIAESVRLLEWADDALAGIDAEPGLRDDLEMRVKYMLGVALVQHRGFGDASVAAAYRRALDLCLANARTGEPEFQIAWGLWAHYLVTADMDRSRRMAERMDTITADAPGLEVLSRAARSILDWADGDFPAQERSIARVAELYRPHLHRIHAVSYSMDALEMSYLFRVHSRYITGDVPGWQAASADVRAHEERLAMPVLRPYIRIWGTAPHAYAGSRAPYRDEIEEAIGFARHLGQPFWIVSGQVWLAHERYHREGPAAAADDLAQAVAGLDSLGIHIGMGFHRARLARALAAAGADAPARAAMDAASAAVEAGRYPVYAAEVLRQRAEVALLLDADEETASGCLGRATAMAAQQGFRAWSALVAGSAARFALRRGGDAAATAADLEARLAALAAPKSADHPAFLAARAMLSGA